MTLEQFKKKAKKIPSGPGVYFFFGRHKKILYIGKAASLRERVRSYFTPDIAQVRSPLVATVVREATGVEWRSTDSVLEALILEANLIHAHKPKGNTDQKDDKSWNYVMLTREDFPRVLLVRGKKLSASSSAKELPKAAKLFGPYPHGSQLKEALKIIRKIFPYRDNSCTPGQGRPCFNRQIGLCPGVCTGEISKEEYRKIIRRISLLLSGKKGELIRSIKRDMRLAAKEERFEEAARLRKQLFALEHIQDVSLIKEEYRSLDREGLRRIEAYDVAHLGGSAAVGVMAVVEDGSVKKQDYRMFRIRHAKGGDDPGALKEILSRRLGHDEWPLPKLIVVDGAAAQLTAASKVLEHYGIGIPLVGVVKDEKHRPRRFTGEKNISPAIERDILLANAEAHRFAIQYHRKRSRAERGI
jgi:excinuclease ABC subunit C